MWAPQVKTSTGRGQPSRCPSWPRPPSACSSLTACIPALPVALLFASRLPGALMHTLPGGAPSATCPSYRQHAPVIGAQGLDWRGAEGGAGAQCGA